VQLPDDGVFVIRVDFAFTAHRMSEKSSTEKKSKTFDGAGRAAQKVDQTPLGK
jgi:hypothetical protein